MAVIKIFCPDCGSDNVIKNGKDGEIQQYRCMNLPCKNQFRYQYKYKAYEKGVQESIIAMHENGSSIADISRVLKISENTVSSKLKKKRSMNQIK